MRAGRPPLSHATAETAVATLRDSCFKAELQAGLEAHRQQQRSHASPGWSPSLSAWCQKGSPAAADLHWAPLLPLPRLQPLVRCHNTISWNGRAPPLSQARYSLAAP